MRIFRLGLSVILLMAMMCFVAGCNNTGDATGTSKKEQTSGTNNFSALWRDSDTVEAPIMKKYNDIVTLTTARWVNSDLNDKYRDGDTWEDNIWTRFVKDKLGIELKDVWTAPDWEQFERKLTLSIAAGEPLPDFVFDFYNPGNPTLRKVMENYDILLPDIKEAFEIYASPTAKEAYGKAGDDIWEPFIKDGRSYALPLPNDGIGNTNCLYIRKDWLDSTGLEIPEAIDELDEVLAAFKNEDSKRNGITFSWKDNFSTFLADTSWVFGAYGAIPGIWMQDGNSGLVYGSVRPEIKEGLAKLRDWFSKGYISMQAAMYNEWDMMAKDFVAEKSGIISAPVWLYLQIKDNLLKNNKNAQIEPIKVPVGPGGKAMRLGYPKLKGVIFFSKDFRNMEAFFNYFNTLWEIENPVSEIFKYGFIEGMDYGLDAYGNPLYGEEMKTGKYPMGKYEGWENFVLAYNSSHDMPYKVFDIFKKLADGMKPSTPYEKRLNSTPELQKKAAVTIYSQSEIDCVNEYYGPASVYATVWDQLKKKEMQTFCNIIYGQLPLDAFDVFVEEWKAQGGGKITEEFNRWYAAKKKQHNN